VSPDTTFTGETKAAAPPLGAAPPLRTPHPVLSSTTLRAASGSEIYLYRISTDGGASKTVLFAPEPAELSGSDAVGLAHFLLEPVVQVSGQDVRHDRTLSAVEVLAVARKRGATHFIAAGSALPICSWAPYGKPPAASCARFVEHPDLPSVYLDASQPEARPNGWAFVTLEAAGRGFALAA
jgi:hypothetical protein